MKSMGDALRDCQKTFLTVSKRRIFFETVSSQKNVAPLPEPLLRKVSAAIYLN